MTLPPLFVDATNTTAFLKCGLMGHTGSGKTRTATEIAIGLVLHCRELDLEYAKRPAFFFDTETGSDWVIPLFRKRGIEIKQAKSRAFTSILEAVRDAEVRGSVLLIDSITHVWREFCEAYRRRAKRTRLEFQDWDVLKKEWARFTDAFVNSKLHIVVCGRAGYEYEFQEKDDGSGKKELIKTGLKMKAESEFGYEPSLLVSMERESNPSDLNDIRRVAHILKDRSDTIDGKAFINPTFKDFLPHVEYLNLGGEHIGLDTSRTSDGEFAEDGDSRWRHRRQQVEICLEEIEAELVRKWPSTSNVDKLAKAEAVEKYFGTRSWTKVGAMSLEDLRDARNRLWLDFRGHAYGQKPTLEQFEQSAEGAAAAATPPLAATSHAPPVRDGDKPVRWRNPRGFPPTEAKVGDLWEHPEDGSIDLLELADGGVCRWILIKPEAIPFDDEALEGARQARMAAKASASTPAAIAQPDREAPPRDDAQDSAAAAEAAGRESKAAAKGAGTRRKRVGKDLDAPPPAAAAPATGGEEGRKVRVFAKPGMPSPTKAEPGDLWWSDDLGRLYEWRQAPRSGSWVWDRPADLKAADLTARTVLADELVAAGKAVGKDDAELRAFAGETLPLKSHPASLYELSVGQLVNVRAALEEAEA